MPYKIVGEGEDAVPGWDRRPPKWQELVDAVLALKPGRHIIIDFDSHTEARRASNAVRDQANLQERAVVVRTRVVKKEDGSATLYLIRVMPEEK